MMNGRMKSSVVRKSSIPVSSQLRIVLMVILGKNAEVISLVSSGTGRLLHTTLICDYFFEYLSTLCGCKL